MKEDEMDKACGMHEEEEKCIKCSGGKPKGKTSISQPTKAHIISHKTL